MTIAQAFNDIAVAQGGTPSKSGTIAGAIDALNDALAGSDQQSAQTIEDAVRLLGQNIGGGSSVTVESLTATENKTYTAPEGKAYSPVTVNVSGGGTEYAIKCYLSTDNGATYTESTNIVYEAEWSTEDYIWVKKEGTQPITKSAPGVPLFIDNQEEYNVTVFYGLGEDDPDIPISTSSSFVMPAHSVAVARIILH